LAVKHEVELRAVNGDWMAGCMRDVSLSGALVRTSLALPLYSQVTVLVPGIAEPIAGFVVRLGEGTLALEWADPAPHVVTYLRTLGIDAAELAHPPIRTPRSSSLNWHGLAQGAKDMLLGHRH
jgi:hypothetical protein